MPAGLHPARGSVRARLTLAITAVVVVTLCAVTLDITRRVRAALTEQVGESFQQSAEGLSRLTGAFFFEKVGHLQSLSVSQSLLAALGERQARHAGDAAGIRAEVRALDARWRAAGPDDPLILRTISADPSVNPVAAELNRFLADFPEHGEVFLSDRYGATLAATGRLSDYDQADEGWWQAAWNGGRGAVYVSSPQYDESAGVTALLVAVPVVGRQSGEVLGILRSTLVVDELFRVIAGVEYGQTGHAVLLDAQGAILFAPGASGDLESQRIPGVVAHLAADGPRIESRSRFATDAAGARWIYSCARFPVPDATAAERSQAEKQVLLALAQSGWTIVVQQRLDEALASVDSVTRSILTVGGIALLLACGVAIVLARSVTRPLVELGTAADALGLGDLDAALPDVSDGEIGQLTNSFGTMRARLRELIRTLSARSDELSRANWFLEQQSLELGLLSEMSGLLQSCSSAEEAHEVIATFVPGILPVESGSAAVMRDSRDHLTIVAVWGDVPAHARGDAFEPQACWALRRGQIHVAEASGSGLLCEHIHASPGEEASRHMCVPMMAQGETLGVLHLEWQVSGPEADSQGEEKPTQSGRPIRRIAIAVADQIALALTNLRLQETLRYQAIRDPLTGLFNRRYMEESLEREVVRAHRKSSPLGVLMLDIDEFKRFNDSFGHDAGDLVLGRFAECLREGTRGEDVVCRYGGEEFAVILPDTSLENATRRAEDLLERARELELRLRGTRLGGITVSAGVAVFPDHGLRGRDLLRAADAALYRAKAAGRDRVFTLDGRRA